MSALKIESTEEKIRRLEAELAEKSEVIAAQAQTIAQKEAEAAASMMMGSTVQEVPCGTLLVEKRNGKGEIQKKKQQQMDGEGQPMVDLDTNKPVYEYVPIMVEVPVFKYKIDLPPSGGIAVKINDVQFYHGEVYEFTMDELRTVKDMVARSWGHEHNIMGQANENAYRKPSEIRLGMRGGRAAQMR